jgi:imidazolonepropionase-like amidohydrolase
MATPAAAQSTAGVAFLNATVVDVDRGVVVQNQTILTSGGRIERVGPASTRVPAGRTRVDLRGAYVIPGLWDMHVHLAVPGAEARDLVAYHGPLLLAHGVTGVRDAGGDGSVLSAMDSAGRSKPGLMPRLLFSGERIPLPDDGADAIATFTTELRARVAAGATFGKLHNDVPADHTSAALGACAAARLRCVAHIPAADTSEWLSAPGRGSYEHLFNLAEHVSSRPAAELFAAHREYRSPTLRQRVLYKLRLRKRPTDPDLSRLAVRDTTRDREFFARFAQSGTWLTPTLVFHHYLTGAVPVHAAATDSSLALEKLPDANRTSAQLDRAGRMWHLWSGLVRAASSGRVNLLAGTDFGSAHVPGAVLHAEMILLQQAGVPAADVLRMATLHPARYLNATDSLGTLSAGRVADLVVLRRNPLEDIRNVSDIEMVMTRGHLLRRAGLDSLIASARQPRTRVRAAINARVVPR